MPGSRTSRRIVIGLAGVIGLLAITGGVWYILDHRNPTPAPGEIVTADSPVPDLRETFPSPFHNIRPGVKYVGDTVCASCHSDIVKTFHAHPMGHSAELVSRATPIERYDAAAKNPFQSMGFTFHVEKTGERMTHRVSARTSSGEALPDYVVSADVAIGSGTRGRTYVSVQHGAVWQSPVSWFTKDARWDVAPTHELLNGGRRPITPGCLFCHTDRVDPVPGSENRFREPLFPVQISIGCERCHGPGELHVADPVSEIDANGIDHTIVNPKHLPPDLRTDICRQCHLQGSERVERRGRNPFDYRPGLPWDQYVTTFIRRPEESDYRKSVGQFEQMETSRCFSGSGGKLSCISCHDPHGKPEPAAMDAFYRSRCLTCHESRGCSAPQADRQTQKDSCVACHMPKADSSNIAHAAITDHRIRKKPGTVSPAAPRLKLDVPFVAYPPGPHAPSGEERDRDWAIAAGRRAEASPTARTLGRMAIDKLTSALGRNPGDFVARTMIASLKGAAGDGPGAVEAAEAAVAVAPGSETALRQLVFEAVQMGRLDVALPAADRLVALNPTSVNFLLARSDVHLRKRDWAHALADAEAILALQPLQWKARLYRAVCWHHQGDPARARKEAAVAAELITTDSVRTVYLRWFREQTW